ncbi:hypothetical protein [Streptomyces sp. NBC_01244]|uniref:hypothetical protein n=1 Tax=Streptomyces sp. NBC_01244 TaxID=2903797 RepID=UPI002E1332A0|nr:hypothetical protein OG247_23865 [Streptomyces sp. NBC_01244]
MVKSLSSLVGIAPERIVWAHAMVPSPRWAEATCFLDRDAEGLVEGVDEAISGIGLCVVEQYMGQF